MIHQLATSIIKHRKWKQSSDQSLRRLSVNHAMISWVHDVSRMCLVEGLGIK
jgi:hypothetical protein